MAQVNVVLVGELDIAIRIDELILPVGIEVAGGILEVLLLKQSLDFYTIDSAHLPVNGSLTCNHVLSHRWGEGKRQHQRGCHSLNVI